MLANLLTRKAGNFSYQRIISNTSWNIFVQCKVIKKKINTAFRPTQKDQVSI